MAMTFYHDEVHIHVDNPGYGEIVLQWRDSDQHPVTVTGPRITMLLEQLTFLALGTAGAPRTLLPPELDRATAESLLPVFQRAVILAVAGTDRYESLYPEPEDGPRHPICVRCGVNGGSTPDDTRISGWCMEHGHAPFGAGTSTTWDQAVARYETQRTLWEARRQQD